LIDAVPVMEMSCEEVELDDTGLVIVGGGIQEKPIGLTEERKNERNHRTLLLSNQILSPARRGE